MVGGLKSVPNGLHEAVYPEDRQRREAHRDLGRRHALDRLGHERAGLRVVGDFIHHLQ